MGATRSGISASGSGRVWLWPGRRPAKPVRSRWMGSQQTVPATEGSAASGVGTQEWLVMAGGLDMGLPSRRPRVKAGFAVGARGGLRGP